MPTLNFHFLILHNQLLDSLITLTLICPGYSNSFSPLLDKSRANKSCLRHLSVPVQP